MNITIGEVMKAAITGSIPQPVPFVIQFAHHIDEGDRIVDGGMVKTVSTVSHWMQATMVTFEDGSVRTYGPEQEVEFC